MNGDDPVPPSSISDLFHGALEQPAGPEREAWLARACGENAALRAELQLLLDHHHEDDFLERAAVATVPAAAFEDRISEQPGDVIGHYRLVEKLGEGGFGHVYAAEQIEPVRRNVALKIIKPGMDTRSVIQRFEAERQALALMAHPNIAQVHDGGATATGRPYFVMELVRGPRLTAYCDEHGLDMRKRLELFVQVCGAIQHAHQKGIIHRDIKPSNVLVAIRDGVPVPKVIDFGIFKAIGPNTADHTLLTRFTMFLGTPSYVSPEQAEMARDIDTRSDIYSLGVLLHELATGRTPFEGQRLSEAGFDEMRRIIRNCEPARPSACLRDLSSGEQKEVARQRHAEPQDLAKLLAGELDWIVMKCLEKDRARRYESAGALAADLRRLLSHEPVLARPPSAAYRLGKFVRRHRLSVTATAAALIALLIGVALIYRQSVRATLAEREQARLRQRAEAEAATSRKVVDLMQDLVAGAGPSIARGRDTSLLRDMLNRTVKKVESEQVAEPEVRARLNLILGNTFRDIGDYTNAMKHLDAALAYYPTDHWYGCEALTYKGEVLSDLGLMDDAEKTLWQALDATERARGTNHKDVLIPLGLISGLKIKLGQPDQAHRLLTNAFERAKRVQGEFDQAVALSGVLADMGTLAQQQGQLDEAERMFAQSLQLRQKALGTNHPSLTGCLGNLGAIQAKLGRTNDAERTLEAGLRLSRKMFPDGHHELVNSLRNVAELRRRQGNTDGAVVLLREATEMAGRVSGKHSKDFAAATLALGNLLMREGHDQAGAAQALQESVGAWRKLGTSAESQLVESLNHLASALLNSSNVIAAIPAAEEVLALRRHQLSPTNESIARAIENVAFTKGHLPTNLPSCLALADESIELRTRIFGANNPSVAPAYKLKAWVLNQSGDLEGAKAASRRAKELASAANNDAPASAPP